MESACPSKRLLSREVFLPSIKAVWPSSYSRKIFFSKVVLQVSVWFLSSSPAAGSTQRSISKPTEVAHSDTLEQEDGCTKHFTWHNLGATWHNLGAITRSLDRAITRLFPSSSTNFKAVSISKSDDALLARCTISNQHPSSFVLSLQLFLRSQFCTFCCRNKQNRINWMWLFLFPLVKNFASSDWCMF